MTPEARGSEDDKVSSLLCGVGLAGSYCDGQLSVRSECEVISRFVLGRGREHAQT
jgi:hypothetical protein